MKKPLALFIAALMTASLISCDKKEDKKPAPHEHTWGNWTVITEPTFTEKGSKTRTCSGCGEIETAEIAVMTLDDVFKTYPDLIITDEMTALGFFETTDELKAKDVFMLIQCQVGADEVSDDNTSKTYKQETLDAFTVKYFGRRFDFSTAEMDDGAIRIEYLEGENAVRITFVLGVGGMSFNNSYVSYEQLDETHFVINYKTGYDGYPSYDYSAKDAKMEIELIDGNYVIVSNKKV